MNVLTKFSLEKRMSSYISIKHSTFSYYDFNQVGIIKEIYSRYFALISPKLILYLIYL